LLDRPGTCDPREQVNARLEDAALTTARPRRDFRSLGSGLWGDAPHRRVPPAPL